MLRACAPRRPVGRARIATDAKDPVPPLEPSSLLSGFVTLSELVALGLIPSVLSRRKEPSATFAWILVLVTFPMLGALLYWYLGRNRVRRPVRERIAVSSSFRERLGARFAARRAATPVEREERAPEEPAPIARSEDGLRGVMRLASKVAKTSLGGGNRARLVVGATPTYDALIADVDAATLHVHLEFYAFRRGAAATRVLEALERAARRGVRVRLLYDAFGSFPAGRTFDPLVRAGGEVAPFFPLDPIRRAATINLRNHRKIVVVDGAIGFCGGINVGDEFVPWRDVMLRFEGPAVAQLQTVFVEDWFFATRRDLDHERCFPVLDDVGDAVLQCVQSGPDQTMEAIHHLYFAAIASARERVWLSTPYFVPDRAMLVALQTAAMRGVDVRLVVPARSNHTLASWAGASFYDDLLECGVRIYEYEPRMLHTKALVVDGRFATVGSANLDVRSFRLNFEIVVLIQDLEVVLDLTVMHLADQRASRELSHAAWRARGYAARVREGVGRLLSPLL